jgi:excisionase family DNA binding protein
MPKISIQEASDLLGVHPDTLRRWEEEGKIQSERTPGGHRRYDIAKLLGTQEKDGKTICYARVSTRPQKQDLRRQELVMQAYCEQKSWDFEVISDIGSGINYNKRGLTKLIKLLLSGEVKRLVITNKDRLLRFGAELIFALCEEQGVEVVIINQHIGSSVEQELVSDVLEIITVFSARLYGLRSHQNKALIQELEKSAQKISQTFGLDDKI